MIRAKVIFGDRNLKITLSMGNLYVQTNKFPFY